jgi:hypothetical protein
MRRLRADRAQSPDLIQPRPQSREEPVAPPVEGYVEATAMSGRDEFEGIDPEIIWVFKDDRARFRYVARKPEKTSRRKRPRKPASRGFET